MNRMKMSDRLAAYYMCGLFSSIILFHDLSYIFRTRSNREIKIKNRILHIPIRIKVLLEKRTSGVCLLTNSPTSL